MRNRNNKKVEPAGKMENLQRFIESYDKTIEGAITEDIEGAIADSVEKHRHTKGRDMTDYDSFDNSYHDMGYNPDEDDTVSLSAEISRVYEEAYSLPQDDRRPYQSNYQVDFDYTRNDFGRRSNDLFSSPRNSLASDIIAATKSKFDLN